MSNPAHETESEEALDLLKNHQRIQKNRVEKVQTVLVVLSSRALILDVESIRHKVKLAYPESAIFFQTTSSLPYGVQAPRSIDLLIDLTGPGQKQPWFHERKLRRLARFCVGRNAGFFRKRLYDRVFDETEIPGFMKRDVLSRERDAQRAVLELAGVSLLPLGDPTPDRAKEIALELPRLSG